MHCLTGEALGFHMLCPLPSVFRWNDWHFIGFVTKLKYKLKNLE